MRYSNWRDQIVVVAKRWPRVFRARLEGGTWCLLGAGPEVQREFRRCAERIRQELQLHGQVEAVDALLFRLKENGFHLWLSQRVKKSRDGSMRLTANHLRVSIYPLRDAVIQFVTQLGHVDLNAQPTPRPSNTFGQVAAAKKNQEREARELIVRALQSLDGITYAQWPGFIKEYYSNPRQHTEYRQPTSPAPFQPPAFDPLNQTQEEWVKKAAVAYQQHCAAFLERHRFWVFRGVDEAVPPAKRTRGLGTSAVGSKRGHNTAIGRRHQWAAKYVLRIPLKEIAAQDGADPSTVGRLARSILRQANWLKAAKEKNRIPLS